MRLEEGGSYPKDKEETKEGRLRRRSKHEEMRVENRGRPLGCGLLRNERRQCAGEISKD